MDDDFDIHLVCVYHSNKEEQCFNLTLDERVCEEAGTNKSKGHHPLS